MEVLITDVTRMAEEHICIAGIGPSGERIRPVLPGGQRFSLGEVASRGGSIEYRRVIEIGDGKLVGTPPELEDVETGLDQLIHVGTLGIEEFMNRLAVTAVSGLDLQAAFGKDLVAHSNRRGWVTPEGVGSRSLAVLSVDPGAVEVYLNNFGKIRARWDQGDIAVNDLRLYKADGTTPAAARVATIQNLCRRGKAFIAMGLTRPFTRTGDAVSYHWLQVNAIHVPDSLQWPL